MYTTEVMSLEFLLRWIHQFSARIPKKDVFGKIRIGDEIEARVTNVKEDGKLD